MIIVLLTLAAVLLAIEGVRRRSPSLYINRLPLPPGPTPLPLVGNVLGIDRNAPYLTYTAWSKIYGDIVYTRVLGNKIIILNSERVAVALLEKRSKKYSDRPEISSADLFGYEWPTSMAKYGPRFRLHRRLLHQVFHHKASLGYRDKQLQKAYELLTHLLSDPARYSEHFITFSAAVVLEVTYGYDMKGGETFLLAMQRCSDIMVSSMTPEVFALCTAFPFVKLLPSWLPGMGWKSEAPECRHLVVDALDTPYEWVKQRIKQGNAVPSMVSDAITRHRLDDDTKDPELTRAIKESAGTLYAATVETTHTTLLTFVYLMMNHPDVQCRAQCEIDRVVGGRCLPDFKHRPSLPYVDAVLRETMRSHPVAPFSVPHATTEDDVYDGYYIPQGATVIPNIWAMSHDEEKYPNPEMFMPERFLHNDGSLNDDTIAYAFGFGRRLCPGRHVGDASLWSAMVCILTLFRIEKTEGSDNVKWSTGLGVHPLPFPCRFVLRDKEMDARKLASLINVSRTAL